MARHAFVDESVGRSYLLVAVIIDASGVAEARRAWQSYAEAHTADNMYPISTREVAPVPVARFSRVVELRAEPDQVWRTITDVKRLVEWVSILEDAEELEKLSRYRATLRDRLGPFKLRADLDITVSDVEEGRRIAGHAVGEDRQVGSRISVRADIHVEPSGDGTQLRVDGRYEVTGRIATLGTSMINNKAQKILDEFVERAGEELD